MERKSCFIGDVICILIIALVVNARVAAAKVEEFHYYKTVVVWPPSFCSGQGNLCVNEILDYFTLHGLLPMYSDNKAVPPYGLNPNCTYEKPMPVDEVRLAIKSFDESLKQDMITYMPNLKNPTSYSANEWLWTTQWVKHAMCFTNSQDPRVYYETALIVPKHMNLVNILRVQGGIVPSNERPYKKATIARIISTYVTKRVKIICNRDESGRVQLFEVEICFEKTGIVKDCADGFFLCGDGEDIWFPHPEKA